MINFFDLKFFWRIIKTWKFCKILIFTNNFFLDLTYIKMFFPDMHKHILKRPKVNITNQI